MTTATTIISDTSNTINIVSGEGLVGRSVKYTGKRTVRAIKSRLTRERCGGDRWAWAEIICPDSMPMTLDDLIGMDAY